MLYVYNPYHIRYHLCVCMTEEKRGGMGVFRKKVDISPSLLLDSIWRFAIVRLCGVCKCVCVCVKDPFPTTNTKNARLRLLVGEASRTPPPLGHTIGNTSNARGHSKKKGPPTVCPRHRELYATFAQRCTEVVRDHHLQWWQSNPTQPFGMNGHQNKRFVWWRRW
jgi:hypothetical protein